VVLQVFFIGLGLFAESEYRDVHAFFGWTILHLSPLIILVAAPLARAWRTRVLPSAALAVTVWIVPILAAVRADLPVAAAFHPVGALLAFWLAIVVARGAHEPCRFNGNGGFANEGRVGDCRGRRRDIALPVILGESDRVLACRGAARAQPHVLLLDASVAERRSEGAAGHWLSGADLRRPGSPARCPDPTLAWSKGW